MDNKKSPPASAAESGARPKASESTEPTRADVLLRGLELVAENRALGPESPRVSSELRELEAEAVRYARRLKRDSSRQQAIADMVRELKVVDEIITRQGSDRTRLNQILLDIQTRLNWLPRPALLWVSRRLDVPLSEIYTVANFYEVLSLEPQGRHQCQVCMGTACHVRGAPQLLDRVSIFLGIKPGETDANQQFSLKTVNCLGCCALGPVLKLDAEYVSNPSTDELKKAVHEITAGDK